jgi:hypothetical protein
MTEFRRIIQKITMHSEFPMLDKKKVNNRRVPLALESC